MFAVMGVTGQVGGATARELLSRGAKVRAIVRSIEKGTTWQDEGCEVKVADVDDAASLKQAFAATDGVFVMLPPIFDPSPGFTEARSFISNLSTALREAGPGRVVVLSTIGAQVDRENLLSQLHMLEAELTNLPIPTLFLRPAWFMENSSWDIEPAKTAGEITSFLQPGDKPVPMVATSDVGLQAAELLRTTWKGLGVVELEGPKRYTPDEIAATFSRLLEHEVRLKTLPRTQWESLFRSHGMKNPAPRIAMLDGFNHGWIEFENRSAVVKGHTTLEMVLDALIGRRAKQSRPI
jgi:uncharacterized protein YbjT (DUF2867 family)